VALKEVELLSAAWYGDKPITINFPSSWDIRVVSGENAPAITDDQIREKINNPIGSPRLSDLALKRNRAVIIIDDITRPTPTAKLIPFILEELKHAGINEDSTIIVVATGTHKSASREDIIKKVGEDIAHSIKVIPHDCRQGLVHLGKSSRETPIYVNQAVMECDLKIGVGGIYPHTGAGFSGGSKIVMPGVCGVETARYTHYYIRGAHQRGKLESDFRLEIEEIASKIGLDFIVNVVLNQERDIVGLFAGDRILAHRQGVKFATELYRVNPVEDADIIIADLYPFDTSLLFATRKGYGPLMDGKNKSSRIAIAACPMGLGFHSLTPLFKSVSSRLIYRLKYICLKEFLHLGSKIGVLKKIFIRRHHDLMVLSPGITEEELKTEFPNARLFSTWSELLDELESRYRNLPVKVVVYRCSPLQIPMQKGLSNNYTTDM
jgi:nickel-dependent lactate racemase